MKTNNNEKINDMMKQLEEGVKQMFTNENYLKYLDTMQKFHRYSVNNCILIQCQKPFATNVASFTDWNKKFHRYVMKGEKGIKIFAPMSYKKKISKIVEDENGDKKEVEKEIDVQSFKPCYVYDISQTFGEELPQICKELEGKCDDFEKMKKAIIDISDCPIVYEKIYGEAKGYYSLMENKIAIRADMSETQTLKTMIHELSHSILHCDNGQEKNAFRGDKEVQAESIAYIVCKNFGIETDDYSFGYITSWSSGKDVKELKNSAQIIKDTATDIINKLEKKLEVKQVESLVVDTVMKLKM